MKTLIPLFLAIVVGVFIACAFVWVFMNHDSPKCAKGSAPNQFTNCEIRP
jgi:hypothetical protein